MMRGRVPVEVSSPRLKAMYAAMASAGSLPRLWELLAAAKRELSSSDWERLKDIDFLSGTSFTHDDTEGADAEGDTVVMPPPSASA